MFFLEGDTVLSQTVMSQMLLDFYAAMGWDENGHPLNEKLAVLDIEPVASIS